jgi:hypothetical protein
MYETVELSVDYGYGSIEYKISYFLNFYEIAKEDIISINIQNSRKAFIIFYTDENSKYMQSERKRNEVRKVW